MYEIFSEYGNFPGHGRPGIKTYRNSCKNLGCGSFPGYGHFQGCVNFPGYGNIPGYGS